jgi:putative pyruvate formate lyase activating enzyme
MDSCGLCPFECHVSRHSGQTGKCGVTDQLSIAATIIHTGEEPPLVKDAGSGTIFFSGCNARCLYCQNYQISQHHQGEILTPLKLAQQMLSLQEKGCSNINWITPTPQLPMALESLAIARNQGLTLPLVYNTNGYLKPDILEMLDGIVDIYLPDFKYGNDLWAEKLSGLPGYVSRAESAVKLMLSQTGTLKTTEKGTAVSGVLVRHLVLPGGLAGSRQVFRTLASIDTEIPVSVLAQYKPVFKARKHPHINRMLSKDEYIDALEMFHLSGLQYGYCQDPDDLNRHDPFFPDFTRPSNQILGGNGSKKA